MSVLGVAAPRDDEVAVGVETDVRHHLGAGGEGVDLELCSQFEARAGEALREDAVEVSILAELAGPRHHEVAVGVTRE